MSTWEHEIEVAIETARLAVAAIRTHYDAASAGTYSKVDGSPVTDADLAADRLIRDALAAAFPDDALLTEESADDAARLRVARCWIVDPIDGTDQFINRTGRFDTLIALVDGDRPVVAVAGHPPSGTIFAAVAGDGAWIADERGRRPVRLASPYERAPVLATSVWFRPPECAEAFARVAARFSGGDLLTITTNARPYDLLAPARPYDALVGLIPNAGHTFGKEWDFAAIDLIVHEAGGRFTDLRGRLHRYNKPVPRNRGGLLVAATPDLHRRLLEAVAAEIPAGAW